MEFLYDDADECDDCASDATPAMSLADSLSSLALPSSPPPSPPPSPSRAPPKKTKKAKAREVKRQWWWRADGTFTLEELADAAPSLVSLPYQPEVRLVGVDVTNVVMRAFLLVPPDFSFACGDALSHCSPEDKSLVVKCPGVAHMTINRKFRTAQFMRWKHPALHIDWRGVDPTETYLKDGRRLVSVHCKNAGQRVEEAKRHVYTLATQMSVLGALSRPVEVIAVVVDNIMTTMRTETECDFAVKLKPNLSQQQYVYEHSRSPQIIWHPKSEFAPFFNFFDRGNHVVGGFKTEKQIRDFMRVAAHILCRTAFLRRTNWKIDGTHKARGKRAWKEPRGTPAELRAHYERISLFTREELDRFCREAREPLR